MNNENEAPKKKQRKPYVKPQIASKKAFETLALSCVDGLGTPCDILVDS